MLSSKWLLLVAGVAGIGGMAVVAGVTRRERESWQQSKDLSVPPDMIEPGDAAHEDGPKAAEPPHNYLLRGHSSPSAKRSRSHTSGGPSTSAGAS